MRAAPPIEVVIRRQGVWAAFVAVVGASALAAVAAWMLAIDASAVVKAAVGSTALLLAGWSCTVAWHGTGRLRWTGRRWQLTPLAESGVASTGGDIREGDVQVAIDLGGWMLLRFTPPAGAGRAAWLPVQRDGEPRAWHALRCAVHAPHAAIGPS